MNLALLIGIEKYDRLPSLAACANDLVNMHELLKATNKYQEIKVLDITSAEEVKKSLRDFFQSSLTPQKSMRFLSIFQDMVGIKMMRFFVVLTLITNAPPQLR